MAADLLGRPIPLAANLALAAGLGLAQCWLFLGPPLLGAPGWTALLPALLTTPFWALLHEAIHGGLLPAPAANRMLGRLLAVLHGSPFCLLRMAHLLHHRFSRIDDLSEAWDRRREERWRAQLRHYGTILGGLYGAELLLGLVMLLPGGARQRTLARLAPASEMGRRFVAWAGRPEVASEARRDAGAAVALLIGAGALWGGDWPWLVAALGLRGLLISFFDNAYHYGTPVGDPRLARNHRLPRVAGWLVLNFNHHGTHHRHPLVPWNRLPAAARADGQGFEGGYWGAALRQLRGAVEVGALPPAGGGPGAASNGRGIAPPD